MSETSKILVSYGEITMKPVSIANATPQQLDFLPKLYKEERFFNNALTATYMRKIAVIGTGQVGGMLAAQLAALGFPTFIVNTAHKDMLEIQSTNLIPEDNFIFLHTLKENGEIDRSSEGTSKDFVTGRKIARDNRKTLQDKLLSREEILNADHIIVCSSTGGGSGSGSLERIIKSLAMLKKKDTDYLTPIHLVTCFPSKAENGISVRSNTKHAMEIIQEMIYDDDSTALGGIYVIDNETVEKNKEIVSQIKSRYSNLSSLKLANVLGMLNIFYAFSIPSLTTDNGGGVIDSKEFMDVMNLGGFLDIRHRFHDTDVVQSFKQAELSADQEGDNTLITSFIKDYVNEILCQNDISVVHEKNESVINQVMVQFIVPNNNSVSATLITALQNEFNNRAGEIDVHFGITYVDEDAGLQGLSLIYVANHFAAPPRYDEILDELVVAQQQFERREALRIQQLEKLARKNAEIEDLDTKIRKTSGGGVRFSDEDENEAPTTKKSRFGGVKFKKTNSSLNDDNLGRDEF